MRKSLLSRATFCRSALALLSAATIGFFAENAAAQPTASATAYDSTLARSWFALANDLTRDTTGFSPPVASRAFGYMGLSLYESVVGGMPGNRSMAGQLNALSSVPKANGSAYHWPSVANASLASMARYMYGGSTAQAASNVGKIDALEQQIHAALNVPPGLRNRSLEHGRAVAAAIYAWSVSDGGHEGYLRNFPTSYVPPVGPGLWVPTEPGFQRALQPFWGQNRPFALRTSGACEPAPHPPYSEDLASDFYAEAFETYDTVNNLTPEQLTIARFWSDDPGATATPPGHSISIASQMLAQKDSSLAMAAEVYARVGIAVADGFISCWWTKFRLNLLRPISYIHAAIDPNWTLPLVTPPFPEYTSGHSVQAGASAEVLTALFGDNVAFVDHTHDHRGFAPRSFSSFFDAADEAAISRLYGGIHFRAAIEEGVGQGICVGQTVNRLRWR
jgi:hypothetical protein